MSYAGMNALYQLNRTKHKKTIFFKIYLNIFFDHICTNMGLISYFSFIYFFQWLQNFIIFQYIILFLKHKLRFTYVRFDTLFYLEKRVIFLRFLKSKEICSHRSCKVNCTERSDIQFEISFWLVLMVAEEVRNKSSYSIQF